MKPRPFRESEWFSPAPGGPYPAAMPGMINGVYGIRDTKSGEMLYIGESHTRRLHSTIRRHLNHWIDRGQPREYWPRHAVEIAWYEIPHTGNAALDTERVKEHEAWLIRHYAPSANTKGIEPLPDWVEDPQGSEWIETAETDSIPF